MIVIKNIIILKVKTDSFDSRFRFEEITEHEYLYNHIAETTSAENV
jgi:hypothetical protein